MSLSTRARRWRSVLAAAVAASILFAAGAAIQPAAAETGAATRPQGAVIIPERFLTEWDPVTFFFDESQGAPGQVEAHPERLATMSPAHPGVFAWIDARTLQFRPAEPWPSLARYRFELGGRAAELYTLLPAPTRVAPADGAEGLDPVSEIVLTFPRPVDAGALAKLLTIELRPLPGLSAEGAWTLDADAFAIKSVERASPGDPAVYVVRLREPIAAGLRAIVRLRLSPQDAGALRELSFATATPFEVKSFGCATERVAAARGGAVHGPDEALLCGEDWRGERLLEIRFSAPPANLDAVALRDFLRVTPPVDALETTLSGATVQVRGDFAAGTLYRAELRPHPLVDAGGRPLAMTGANVAHLSFPKRPDFLEWGAGEAIVERFGPQAVPVRGRGFEKADLRIHKIDPLDPAFWPFPEAPPATDDARRPPIAGEAPPPPRAPDSPISDAKLAERLPALGSPAISELVDLPSALAERTARFGLDLAPHLRRLADADAPGTYLVGLRRPDGDATRRWMRVQVTDLSLTSVEEDSRVRFVATSLSTGAPVAGVEVTVEGYGEDWRTLAAGTTRADGSFVWNAVRQERVDVRRVVLRKGDDVLVLDAEKGLESYSDGRWRPARPGWLDEVASYGRPRTERSQTLCHLFAERPVYRPEEPVHLKAFVRDYLDGELGAPKGAGAWFLIVGPDGSESVLDATVDAYGGVYAKFDEETEATGAYDVYLNLDERDSCARTSFRKEDYRLPTFELRMDGPDPAPLDQPFQIGVIASYYAGGMVANRPTRWRVTQFPYDWTPPGRDGFIFASDGRYSDVQPFRATSALTSEGETDARGSAILTLDPTLEPTAQPRRYVVEATVTGDDDQTVTAVTQIVAAPAFTLGARLERHIRRGEAASVEVIAVGPRGEAVVDKPVEARLIHRQWRTILLASDFLGGAPRYQTEVQDREVFATTLRSAAEPARLDLPVDAAGVYVLRLDALDAVGRRQTLTVDLFVEGDAPVTWGKPPAETFVATVEKPAYKPGETATVLLQSPFQTAQALAVVERADGRAEYAWIDVRGGYGRFDFRVERADLPRLPVHFALMRGRLPGEVPPDAGSDLRRPATLTATAWVQVDPAKHRVTVELDHPARAQPGEEIEITLRLKDDEDRPLAGQATLWLVDQAVLALGKESPLDPLPDFVTARPAHVLIRDTRNMTVGFLPLYREPGGDGEGDGGGLLEDVSLRKNFDPVPYYEPNLTVGPEGEVTVRARLPDSLTNFKLRAKAVSDDDRFGYGVGQLSVRLPVVAQPTLPRFLRAGDRFTAGAMARVVEGETGAGEAEIAIDGAILDGPATQEIAWTNEARARRVGFAAQVPADAATGEGAQATVTIGVRRASDGAKDAFQVALPLLPDRRKLSFRDALALGDAPLTLPGVEGGARPGSLSRRIAFAGRPEIVRMAAAVDYLRAYPYGCVEQRIALARGLLAAARFDARLTLDPEVGIDQRAVADTFDWIEKAIDERGYVAFWPGARGHVPLTAWALEFAVEARAAGYAVDQELTDRLIAALQRSLRSDPNRAAFAVADQERAWALKALAHAGRADAGYAAELARRTQHLNLEGVSLTALALAETDAADAATLKTLNDRLWSRVVLRLENGREVYGGLQNGSDGATILPSETRTVAQALRAAVATAPGSSRQELLVDALVRLGSGDGWGDTNANAEALMALADFAAAPTPAPGVPITITGDGRRQELLVGGDRPLTVLEIDHDGPVTIARAGGGAGEIAALSRVAYVPSAPGSEEASAQRGFAVARTMVAVPADDGAPTRVPLDAPGRRLAYAVGDVVEDQIEIVNPVDRTHVAVVAPLAAGFDPLNPALETAPPEATPSLRPASAPSYVAFRDDRIMWFYDELPKGTYRFAVRLRATTEGEFTLPAPYAQAMYDDAVTGNGAGARVVVGPAPETGAR